MKYAYPQLENKTRFLTFGIVADALRRNGHKVTSEINVDTDYVLYSIADVMDMRGLRKLRSLTKKNIIAGGHYAINFWSASNYADMVWLGEVFDFAKLHSRMEIENSCHIYRNGDDINNKIVSTRIDWDNIPVVQIKKTSSYYLGAVGCKNNCKFCHTAWTHPHQENSVSNIKAAQSLAKVNKVHINIVSNEYDYQTNLMVKDMLGVDYLKVPIDGGTVRIGIEFAREDTRKMAGKPLSKDDIYKILQKAKADSVILRLFHIGGYEDRVDWEKYIIELGEMLDYLRLDKLVHLQFTNLQYQNYTPIYRERWNINHKNYLTIDDTRRWYDYLRRRTKSILVGAPSRFGHVAYRMGVELSTQRSQSERWMNFFGKRAKVSSEDAYQMILDTGIFETPRYILKRKTGKIVEVGI